MRRLILAGAASLMALTLAACDDNASSVMSAPTRAPLAATASAEGAAREAQGFVDKAGHANLVEIRAS